MMNVFLNMRLYSFELNDVPVLMTVVYIYSEHVVAAAIYCRNLNRAVIANITDAVTSVTHFCRDMYYSISASYNQAVQRISARWQVRSAFLQQ